MKRLFLYAICYCLGVFFLTGPVPVLADDGEIGASGSEIAFSGTGIGAALEFTHDDDDPYKGWLTCWVENTGTTVWWDFHIKICDWEKIIMIPVSPIFDDSVNLPTSSQSNFTYSIDNDPSGAIFNFYFDAADPVGIGETAWFKVWTDNTANTNDWFDIQIYPTAVVPVPSAIILLGSGLVGLLGFRRRIGKALEK